jgi:hypothetical protein
MEGTVMRANALFLRAMTLSASLVLAVGVMGWASVAPTKAASSPTLTVYQSANFTGSSWTTSAYQNPDLTTVAGPCQNYFWETRSWNDCIASFKFTNVSGSTYSLTLYQNVNYAGPGYPLLPETYYCLKSGYTWQVSQVVYNHQASSYRFIVNNIKPGGNC